MTNAKEEFIKHVAGKIVLCAIILRKEDRGDKKPVAVLKTGFTFSEYCMFLSALDFEYDSGYGFQELFGLVWYKDGAWSDRKEYDGSERWQLQQVPEIPKECDSLEDLLANTAGPKLADDLDNAMRLISAEYYDEGFDLLIKVSNQLQASA